MCKELKGKDPTLCTVEGCFSERSSSLYCQKHYRRNKLYGDPLFLKNKRQEGLCSVDGCKSKAVKRGLCDKHYFRLQKYGDPEKCMFERDDPEKINIINRIRKNCIVSKKTGCWEWQKYRNKAGYGRVTYKGEKWSVHRLSYTEFVGEVPEDTLVLHKCDNPCCCNPEHLYIGNHTDNIRDVYIRDRRDKNSHNEIIDKYTAIQIFGLLGEKSNKEIAEIVGVSPQSVERIRRKKTHRNIYDELPKEIKKTIRFKKGIKPDSSRENNPSASLSSTDVLRIRKMYGEGKKVSEITEIFAVGRTTIQRVIDFETWRNLSLDPDKDAVDLYNSHVDSSIRRRKKEAKEHYDKAKKRDTDNLKIRREIGSGNLTEKEVIKIKKLLKKGELTNTEIGRKFGVTSWAISRIKCGKNWTRIEI